MGGVLLSLTVSSSASATSNRVSSIKSHGTLEYTDENRDMLITAEDLKYLASECDKLEQAMDALQMTGNPNIRYTYHQHKNGSGTVLSQNAVISGYGNPGGCFQHSYHVHTSACEYKSWHTHEHCTIHGDETSGYWTDHHYTPHTSHTGDTRNNRWSCSCHWREGEIEKAEIVFQPVN